MSVFFNLSAPWQALIATLFTFLITSAGASIVFFFKKVNKTLMDAMLGFAAGVMMSASYFSLLAPAISGAESLNLNPWLIATTGFLLGGLLLYLSDKIFDKILAKSRNSSKKKRIFLLIPLLSIIFLKD